MKNASISLFFALNSWLLEVTSKKLSLFAIDEEWDEYGVTFANKPGLGELITDEYTVTPDMCCIEFDIQEYVIRKIWEGASKLGFYLIANDESEINKFQFFTKEADKANAPIIHVEYYIGSCRSLIHDHMTANNWTNGSLTDSTIWMLSNDSQQAEYKNSWTYVQNGNYTIEARISRQSLQSGSYSQINLGLISFFHSPHRDYVLIRNGRGWIRQNISAYGWHTWKLYYENTGYYKLFRNNVVVSEGIVKLPDKFTIRPNCVTIDSQISIDYLFIRECLGSPIDDGQVWSCGTFDYPSKLYVAHTKNANVFSKLRVNTSFGESETISRIRVIQDHQRISTISVNKPNLPTIIGIGRYAADDLLSKITVCQKLFEEFSGKLDISKCFISANIYLPHSNGIISALIIKARQNNDLISRGTVNRKQLISRVSVRYTAGKNSSIIVRGSQNVDLPSCFTVYRFGELIGRIHPKIHLLLKSNIVVRRRETNSLKSQLSISRSYINGKIHPAVHYDLYGKISAKQATRNDSNWAVAVSRNVLPITVYVKDSRDLRSAVNIRVTSRVHLEASVLVTRLDLYSSIFINNRNDLYCTFNIEPPNSNLLCFFNTIGANHLPVSIRIISGNLKSVLAIAAHDLYDFKGNITARAKFKSDIFTILDIENENQITAYPYAYIM